jgi:hypothetical protein
MGSQGCQTISLGVFGGCEGLEGLNYKAFGVFDLAQNQPDIHGRVLGLPLAAAVNAMLSDQREGIGQNIEGGGQPPPYWTHLELILLAGFVVMFQHFYILF